MAFLNKIGNLLKKAAGKHIKSGSSFVSGPSRLQSIRCFSSIVYIGGLSYNTDELSLKEVFGKYGDVLDARVIVDRETGRSRGFGFVTYHTVEEASSAIQALDGQDLHGRVVRVNYTADRLVGGSRYGATDYGPSNSEHGATGHGSVAGCLGGVYGPGSVAGDEDSCRESFVNTADQPSGSIADQGHGFDDP